MRVSHAARRVSFRQCVRPMARPSAPFGTRMKMLDNRFSKLNGAHHARFDYECRIRRGGRARRCRAAAGMAPAAACADAGDTLRNLEAVPARPRAATGSVGTIAPGWCSGSDTVAKVLSDGQHTNPAVYSPRSIGAILVAFVAEDERSDV